MEINLRKRISPKSGVDSEISATSYNPIDYSVVEAFPVYKVIHCF